MLRSALAGGVASFLTTFVLQGLSSEQNMKTLKVTVVLIVVIVGLTLVTFRVTGLEPEYLAAAHVIGKGATTQVSYARHFRWLLCLGAHAKREEQSAKSKTKNSFTHHRRIKTILALSSESVLYFVPHP